MPKKEYKFKRSLNLFDATMLLMGSMIGSGIFIVTADVARTVGSSGYMLVAWAVAGVMTVIAALCYGELASMMPRVGGQYVYLREAYNPLMGFLYGWTFFLVMQTGTIAAISMAFAKYTGVIFPFFSDKNVLLDIGLLKINSAQLLAISIIVVLTYVNTRGLQGGKMIQNIFTVAKIAALVGLIVVGIFIGKNYAVVQANFANMWSATWTHVKDGQILNVEMLNGIKLIAVLGIAMVGPLFAADSWTNMTAVAGEIKKPKINIPVSLVVGTAAVMTLYVLANFAYLFTLPMREIQFAVNDRVAAASIFTVVGGASTIIMAALIMVSTFGCSNGAVLSGARVYYAMAKDKLFFKKIGELNERNVPGFGLVTQAVWASLLCLSGSYSDLLDYVIFAALLFYIMTVIGLFILRVKKPKAQRPYKTWGYPVLPALYLLMAAFISVCLLIYKPMYTWPGLGIVLLGVPVYYIWKKI
ncbi:MAG: amino acid permease [Pseudomonadota bacterium]